MSTSTRPVSAPPLVQFHINGDATTWHSDATTKTTTPPSPSNDEGDNASPNAPGPDDTGESDATATPPADATEEAETITTGVGETAAEANPASDDGEGGGGRNGDPGTKDGAGLYAIFSQNGGRGNAATNVANTGSTRQAATTRGGPSGSRIGNLNQGIGAAAGNASDEEGIPMEQAGGVGGQTPNAENGGEDGQGDKDGEGGPPIPVPASPTQWTEAELRLQDSKLQPFTAADWRLMSIYHDTVHHNDRTHLHGPISEGGISYGRSATCAS